VSGPRVARTVSTRKHSRHRPAAISTLQAVLWQPFREMQRTVTVGTGLVWVYLA
jgi:hypothetical protein